MGEKLFLFRCDQCHKLINLKETVLTTASLVVDNNNNNVGDIVENSANIVRHTFIWMDR